jgi:hypothetical protein
MATDRELRAHKEWLGMVQPVGLVVSPAALVRAQIYPTHPIIDRQNALLRLLPDSDDDRAAELKDFPAFCTEVLGWRVSDLVATHSLPEKFTVSIPEYNEVLSPTYAVPDPDRTGDYLILIEVTQAGENLDRARTGGDNVWHATPQERFNRLLRETGVPIGLLCNGLEIRLIYAPSGESPGHISFRFEAMCEVAGRPILAACHTLLSSERLFSVSAAQRLPRLLSESRKYQTEVSIKLAEQVLEAQNELLNGFSAADRASDGRLLGDAIRSAPDHVYGGMLSVLLRLVFILYAEERGMLPVAEIYQRNYSVIGLFERLREDDARFHDTMDHRFSAWPQLLTLFRLIFDGGAHGKLMLPARHGRLFDPDAYPFLEGRPFGTRRVIGERIVPPKLADGVVYRVLDKLLILDGERLSYSALDVEQIGSVYEAMMGFELVVARGPSIGLRPDHIVVNLEEVLEVKPAARARILKETAGCDITGATLESLKAANSVDEIVAALSKRISKRTSNVIAAGAIFLQPTEERRRSGSHYTPRSLTEPIVKTTLRPIFEAIGDRPTPDQILDLKICDPAMGSGAFLVEACRLLGDKLVQAWNAHSGIPRIPPDEDPHLYARRIVAQRCLYGVDKNPFAVDLAKLSLWLTTLARDHPFTFLDHALRCGDSLVGLTHEQIACFNWEVDLQIPTIRPVIDQAVKEAESARGKIQSMAGSDDVDEKTRLLKEAEDALDEVRMIGDLAIAAFFGAEKKKEREQLREKYEAKVRAFIAAGKEGSGAELRGLIQETLTGVKSIRPFHWEIEFPEVFSRKNMGFDAFVGNPPFLGGVGISRDLGMPYFQFLVASFPPAGHQCDLVAYFFRRAFALLRDSGCFGLIATNTIAQGDTREGGLRIILSDSGHIFVATRRLRWPGLAAVVVSVVHVFKGRYKGLPLLDTAPVARISAYLVPGNADESPLPLHDNPLFTQGSAIAGQGFLFDDLDSAASSLSLMQAILERNPRCAERILPYIGGEELNNHPRLRHHRYVIFLSDLRTEEELKAWPELVDVVREMVKPERDKLGPNPNNIPLKKRWWAYHAHRPDFYAATEGKGRVLAINCGATPHMAFAFLPTRMIYSKTLAVFVLDTYAAFGVLQSRVHEVWARFFSSTFEDRLRYAPSDCFLTFPFPQKWESDQTLEYVGKEYYEVRAELMVRNNEGLTKTYNHFHDPEERDAKVFKLRELHDAMDRAVVDAYGWTDLMPTCEFILDYEEKEEDEDGRLQKRKKPWRYRWPDEFREAVLARLLALNQERAAQEKAMANASRGNKKTAPGSKKASENRTLL